MVHETDYFKRLIIDWGASLVGIGDISKGVERAWLSEEFRHFTRAISIAKHCETNGKGGLAPRAPDDHARMMSYMDNNENAVRDLNDILKKIGRGLKREKHRFFTLPPVNAPGERMFSSALFHLFPHRIAATCSGLGWIGKSGMLINREYGPNLMWATVLTDAPLQPSAPVTVSQCQDCDKCRTMCPAGAIRGELWNRDDTGRQIVDPRACVEFMRKNEKRYGRPVCGICFMSCPMGQDMTGG